MCNDPLQMELQRETTDIKPVRGKGILIGGEVRRNITDPGTLKIGAGRIKSSAVPAFTREHGALVRFLLLLCLTCDTKIYRANQTNE